MSSSESDMLKTFAPSMRRLEAERFYSGEPEGQVLVHEGARKRPLDPRFDLCQHSPAELGWGNAGCGTSQLALALALLADALDDDARALQLYLRFSCRVVASFPQRWTITRSRILAHVDLIEDQVRDNPAAVLLFSRAN